jgi:alpha-galactosidase
VTARTTCTDENPAQERADCWEFELVSSLVKIAERVCEACPDAIVDLDLTESGRALGLAFLSTGKQFLINNGPYYGSYDIPTPGTNENLLFYPGSARATLCRSALAYDRWIPSILFLTHFFPDDSPESIPHWSQPQGKANSLEVNLASLILGGNGLWGDLLTLSPQGNEYTANVLTAYKRVRNAITRASPVRSGSIGASPEIHEKIFDKEGVVVIFSPRTGHYATITHSPTGEVLWCSQGVSTAQNSQDLTRIEAVFDKPGAKIIFFHDKK